MLQSYLNKQQPNITLIQEPPEKLLQLVVIIPAFNEPDVIKTLESIKKCNMAPLPTEVIVLINNSEDSPQNIIDQNKLTFIEVSEWIKTESTSHLKYHCIIKNDFPKKYAGVGLARKTLMDEACRRFAYNLNEIGVIASCDADSLVSKNYLTDIQNTFAKNKKLNCATFCFEHQITPNLSEANKIAIILYELYLRYFKLALFSTGFPYAFHTVGSSFAVRSLVYAKQGGMSKRQAGEDFYFLHKIFPLGNCTEINKIKVYPSSRPSDRVPFGTGNAVQKILNDNEFLTYHPIYFIHLKTLFSSISNLYNSDANKIASFYQNLDSTLQSFMGIEEFTLKIMEINTHSASEKTFIHRFFNWFDAFSIIKYLNFVHQNELRIPVTEAVLLYLAQNNWSPTKTNPKELLDLLKEIELGLGDLRV